VGLVVVLADRTRGTEPIQESAAPDPLVQLVIDLLRENDKEMRALGYEQVRTQARGGAATSRFADLLPGLSPDAQVGLLSALADRGDAAALPAVRALLAGDLDPPVRVAAVGALGVLGETADVERLVELLRTAPPPERAAARTGLVRLEGPDTPAAIAAAMKQAAPASRVALLEILAARRALETIPDILAAAIDDDPAVRTAAMSALGQLAGPQHVPGMVQGVLKAQKGPEREAAEKAVMLVCQRIPDADRRADPLLLAMRQRANPDRRALLSTLGRVGGPSAWKVVGAALNDNDPQLHDLGLRALCNWPDASVAPQLRNLVNGDEHPEHRTLALRALIRIAPLADQRSDLERLELLQAAMAICERDAERNLALDRARSIRIPETLRFVLPYVQQPALAEQACLTVVELAHDRTLREPHQAEFHAALDLVIQTSRDATVVDRAQRYKKNQTWVRPKPAGAD